MNPELDCGEEGKHLVSILEGLYKLDDEKEPNYNEIDFKLALVDLNEFKDPLGPIFDCEF
jgi:hypothetical protein